MKGGKVTVLILLLLVLAAVNLWRQKDERQEDRKEVNSGSNPSRIADTQELTVDLHLLNRIDEGSPGVEKNLFGSIFDRPSPPPPKPSSPVQVEVQPLPPPPPPPSPVLQRQPPIPPPSGDVLGFLNKKGDRRIFLSMGKKVFAVRERECFGERDEFCLAKIADDHLLIQQEGRSLPLSIPLIEEDRKVLTGQNEGQERLLHAPKPAFIPLPGYSARASLEPTEEYGQEMDVVQVLPDQQAVQVK